MNLADLQDSIFLKSLGWALANSLWQGAVLLAFYHIVIATYKNTSSKFKNNISTTFLFCVFTWFTVTFLVKLIALNSEIKDGETVSNLVNEYSTHQEKFGFKLFIDSTLQTLPYLSVAYLLLLIILLAKLINSYRSTSFIKNHGLLKPGVEWRLFTEKVAHQISIGKKVQIWLSKYVDVPATLGFFKPVILIPVASVNQLSVQQLEAIILHELSHIKRNDYVVNLFISIIETVLFFNPFVVLLSNIIKKERENCCDDFVLQYQYDRHSYASALLSLEKTRNKKWNLALASTSGKKQLLSRIKRIMEVKSKNSNLNYGQKLIALLLITGIIGSIAWLSPEKKIKVSYAIKISEPDLNPGKSSSSDQAKNILPSMFNYGKTKTSETPQSKKIANQNIDKDQISLSEYDKVNADRPPEENEDLPFTFAENDQNNYNLDNNFDNATPLPLPPSPPMPPSISYNLHTAPQAYLPNIKLLNDLHLDINIKELENRIEEANQSIAKIDWEKMNQQIRSSLRNVKHLPEINKAMQQVDIERILNDIRLEEKNTKERSRDLQENLKALSRLDVNNHKKLSLPKKRSALYNSFDNETAFNENSTENFELQGQLKSIEKKIRSQSLPPAFYSYGLNRIDNNSTEQTVEIKNKKSSSNKMSLEFKDGVVYINGEKMTTSNSKKIQAMFKAKKFVIAFDEKENKTESDED